MTSLLQDVRFGLRLLRRQPAFSTIAVVVLALGIGVNTAAFSILDTLLLKPRTGGIDAELAGVYSRHRTRPDTYREFSWAELEDLRARTDLFRSVSGHGMGLLGLRDGDATRRVFADIVSADFFETFGVQPIVGRGFTREEERPGADVPVTVLSYGLWQRMGGRPDVVGQTITLNSRAFTVVGVAPQGFGGSMVMVTPEVWVPTGVYDTAVFDARNEGQDVRLGTPGYRALIVVARLAPGATIASLEPGLELASRQMSEADPAATADWRLELAPLSRLSVSTRPQVDDDLTSFMSVLLALAGVVLLIASFNLANMLLARGRARSQEFAIRAAIGGSRRRLTRQLLTEHLVLALAGGAAGLLVSSAALRLLLRQMPDVLPLTLSVDTTPDVRVLGATVAFSIGAALVFGLGPAWRFGRRDPMADLKPGAGEGPARRGWFRGLTSRNLLMTAQLALTFVMLTAAGLVVRGALQAARTDPGFTLDRGIIANLDTSFLDYAPARSLAFYTDAVDRLRALPGVASASLASHMPFGEFENSTNVQKPGTPLRSSDPDAGGRLAGATTASVGRDYFETMGIARLAGRGFTEAEATTGGGDPVAIIDETLARRLFGTPNAVGELIQTSPLDDGTTPVLRVVGVVAGVRANLFDREPQPFLYYPFGQQPVANAYLHARTTADSAAAEAAMLPSIRAMLSELAPTPPIVALETRPMFRERNLLLAVVRTGASIFAVFGGAALFLAAVGVYGVKSYLVARRTKEIGVRVALGAEPRDVVWMVLREGLVLVAFGLVAGAGLSILTGWGMRAVTFQGQAMDLAVVGLAAATLVGAMLVASWLPARRATRVAPTTALRA